MGFSPDDRRADTRNDTPDGPSDGASPRIRQRRWILVLMLALATLAMHAVLTGATPTVPEHGGAVRTAAAVTPSVPFSGAAGDEAATPNPADRSILDFKLPAFLGAALEPLVAGDASGATVTVHAKLDRRSVLVGSDSRLYAEVVINGRAPTDAVRHPTDLLVVLDHSGSMRGDKIRQAKKATADLIDRLAPDDTFALIAFSDTARLMTTTAPATSENRAQWLDVLRRIHAGGGTNMKHGLDVALRVLRARSNSDRPCRVLLLSDGHPNTTEGLVEQARRASGHGAALSALGIGADFNENLMSELADYGTGNYYFLDRPETIAAVFAGELAAGRGTIARDLRITLKPSPGTSLVDAAGYPIETTADGAVIRPGHLYAGQTRRLWLALDVDAAEPFAARPLGEISVSWDDGEATQTHVVDPLRIAGVTDREHHLAGIDNEAWGRAVVSEEYGRLQREVADFVRNGQRQEAEARIFAYEQTQAGLNTFFMNDEVTENLESLKAFKREIDDAFTGEGQVTKQKMLSKRQHQMANELRRLDSGSGGGGR
ncbi:MAG: VWA domain-containing protein [Acidobacteriota bacterium]